LVLGKAKKRKENEKKKETEREGKRNEILFDVWL